VRSEYYRVLSPQRVASEAAWARLLADALRKLLHTPLADPGHAAALVECKARLECYDDDQTKGAA
jgi:hypothetical protein